MRRSRLADGTRIGADAVIVGIGAAPQTRLAEEAGLDVRDGVVTDASLRTSDPDIYAAGDIANAFHPLLGRHIRVEHWANALHQPQTAAAAMLGWDAVYDRVPYFYTDQYDLGMEYAGYAGPGGYDQVIFRGDVSKREFIAFWLSGGRVAAGMNVNIWDVNDAIGDLIRSGQPASRPGPARRPRRPPGGGRCLMPTGTDMPAALTASEAVPFRAGTAAAGGQHPVQYRRRVRPSDLGRVRRRRDGGAADGSRRHLRVPDRRRPRTDQGLRERGNQ